MNTNPLLFIAVYVISLTTQAQTAAVSKPRIKQYDKRITFDIRLEPTALFTLQSTTSNPVEPKQKFIYKTHSDYVGLRGGFGIAVNKQFHIDAIAGFERKINAVNIITVPVGIDAHINILKRRFSPFIHFGGGYLDWYDPANNSSLRNSNGSFATAGIGFYARLNSFLALAISPDYRLVYFGTPFQLTDATGNIIQTVTIKTYIQQIGLHLAIIFY